MARKPGSYKVEDVEPGDYHNGKMITTITYTPDGYIRLWYSDGDSLVVSANAKLYIEPRVYESEEGCG